jgi:glycosyltransferase involved in cell wall biosynthesis
MIPWGVETSIFRPTPNDRLSTRKQLGIPPEAWVFLCPRKIAKLYNQDAILEAFKRMLRRNDQVRLAFVVHNADPQYLSHLHETISRYALERQVLWLPSLSSAKEMAALYRMADAVVSVPSSEGYGFTVYEAMACGCPTIISDLPVFDQELIDDLHTLKVPAKDADETSRAMDRLMGDRALGQKLRQNGQRKTATMDVSDRITATLSLYQRMCKDFHRGP